MMPEVVEPHALESLTRAEVDIQITTARRYPRDVAKSVDRAKSLMCRSQRTAEECIYAMPRDGRTIEGPSVRAAEILASTWGNLRVAARVMEIGKTEVTCAGICQDLESNVSYSVEVKRRIVKRNGQRFNEDMIITTANAGCSIAHRNATLKVIPKALWLPAYQAAVRLAREGGGVPIEQRRRNAIQWFANMGVTEKQVLAKLKKTKVGHITEDDLVTLKGIGNAIREECSTVEEVFGNGGTHVEKVSLEADVLSPENYQDPKVPEMTETDVREHNAKYKGIFGSPSEEK